MTSKFDLTEGPILNKLISMALPIMATSFMQMAFNLADMFWLSSIEGGVAASGTASLYVWLSMALIWIGRMGAQIGVSQNMGRGEPDTARRYAQNSFGIAVILGILFAAFVIIFQHPLIGFFNIDDPTISLYARQYLVSTAFALPFIFAHQVITGVFIGFGNTKIPFYINSLGLLINIAITPMLIFWAGMGVVGAGVGTIIASIINLVLKIWVMRKWKGRPFPEFKLFARLESGICRQIFRWGVPIGMESALFTLLFMIVTRLVSDFGDGALAAQRVGSQVESLAWMMAGGFASAVTAFMGQNFGAKKYGRMRKAYAISLITMGSYGLFVTFVLFVFAGPLIGIFLSCPYEIQMGVGYLRIFAVTQTLFCMEEVAAGSFRGRGMTINPTIVSVTSNVIRVILAYSMVTFTDLGVYGIWIGIAISVTIRSIWMLVWYKISMRKKLPKHDEISECSAA
ncbi:MAG: MATE family efflux transporter [Defluviitaleaceae bacterium]|nr:MATE family efflux transporter [Defluviitaleaceae bacterium]